MASSNLPTRVPSSAKWDPRFVNQLVSWFLGDATSGFKGFPAKPLLDDASNFLLTLRNKGKKHLDARHSSDRYSMLEVTDDGVKAGDGTADPGLVATQAGSETLTNKQLLGFRIGIGTTVTSNDKISLPDDGNVIPISNSNTITTIRPKQTAWPVILRFLAGDCWITDKNLSGSGNVYLTGGPYLSRAGSTLTLLCDGADWWEIGRSGARVLAIQYSRIDPQTLVSGVSSKIVWQRYSGYPGGGMSIGGDDRMTDDPWGLIQSDHTSILLKYPGIYLVTFTATLELGNVYGRFKASLGKYDPAAAAAPGSPSSDPWFAVGDGVEVGVGHFTQQSYSFTNNLTAPSNVTRNNILDHWPTGSAYDATYASDPETPDREVRQMIHDNQYKLATKFIQVLGDLSFGAGVDETTVVGAHLVESDGTNKVEVTAQQTNDPGINKDLSIEPYETQMQVVLLGQR